MPPVDRPPLVAPVPAIQVISPFRAAPRFQPGGRRVVVLAATPGGAVLAPCAGRVSFRGRVAGGAPSLTIVCLGTGDRVTLSRLDARLPKGASAAAGGVLGRAARTTIGLSVRRAGVGYVDPLPLLARAPRRPPAAPVAPPRLPVVRLDRPVRTLPQPVRSAGPSGALQTDRWLGGAGSVLGLGVVGAWLWGRRRRAVARVPRAAVHPAAPRR